ncbi:hypothetical protein IW261DRAFT_1595005 [Armillaria novae-zelandiae]|uniref:Uncharacterized protein n=1 Tax=Armillaria novae-zelandiae TaxID=153914 RepID=A0AA39UBL7_9AGAR|nr:hypothetical protein IW261DRAFT_1595005 [Armillaria novae-zelandiae]
MISASQMNLVFRRTFASWYQRRETKADISSKGETAKRTSFYRKGRDHGSGDKSPLRKEQENLPPACAPVSLNDIFNRPPFVSLVRAPSRAMIAWNRHVLRMNASSVVHISLVSILAFFDCEDLTVPFLSKYLEIHEPIEVFILFFFSGSEIFRIASSNHRLPAIRFFCPQLLSVIPSALFWLHPYRVEIINILTVNAGQHPRLAMIPTLELHFAFHRASMNLYHEQKFGVKGRKEATNVRFFNFVRRFVGTGKNTGDSESKGRGLRDSFFHAPFDLNDLESFCL